MAWYNKIPGVSLLQNTGILPGGSTPGQNLQNMPIEAANYDPNAFSFDKAQVNFGQDPFRQKQMTLSDYLMQSSMGQGPSIADAQAAQARQSLFSQGLSGLASQRVGNPALAQRSLFNALAQGNQGIGAHAGIQRLQEMNQAQGRLGDVLGQGRQADFAARVAQMQSQQELQRLREQSIIDRAKIRAGLNTAGAELQQKNNAGQMGFWGGIIGAAASPKGS